MGNYLTKTISIALAAATLSSCEKPANKAETSTAARKAPLGTDAIRTEDSFTLMSCSDMLASVYPNQKIELEKPQHIFKLTIRYTDPSNIVDQFRKKNSTDGVNESNPDELGELAKTIDKTPKTKWDKDLELRKPAQLGGKLDTALIRIILDPKTVQPFRFMDKNKKGEEMAIRAGDENGYNMFCDLTVQGNVATFKAVYYDNPNEQYTYGHYNIGIIVKDQDGIHEMPMYFDPEVKNDG